MQWFTSDLHFFQRNIVKSISSWEHADPDTLRDFTDEIDMNKHIITKINDNVAPNDELYILGDVSFHSDVDVTLNELFKIKCQNVHLVLGNHDERLMRDPEKLWYRFKSIEFYKELRLKYPLDGTDPNRDPWQGRAHIILSHYAMRVWHGSHRGSIMLYGHSHGSLDQLTHSDRLANSINSYYLSKRTMDVGIDNIKAITGEYRPISLDEIITIMDNRQVIYIDHHEKKA